MKAPFPLAALIAFLLLPLVAMLDSLELPFLPHVGLGPVLLLYIFGGVIGTWLFDYTDHHPAQASHQRHHAWREWFPHS